MLGISEIGNCILTLCEYHGVIHRIYFEREAFVIKLSYTPDWRSESKDVSILYRYKTLEYCYDYIEYLGDAICRKCQELTKWAD